MARIAKIAVAAATYAIDRPYDYLVPETMQVEVGVRVLVPFGRGNRRTEGMILALRREEEKKPLKAVLEVLDQEPQLSQQQLRLVLWMCSRYFCTFYDALHTVLPIGLWYKYKEVWSACGDPEPGSLTAPQRELYELLLNGQQELTVLQAVQPQASTLLRQMEKQGLVSVQTLSGRRTTDKSALLVSLAQDIDLAAAEEKKRRKAAPRQAAALAFLGRSGETNLHELMYFTGVSRRAVSSLEKEGLVKLREEEIFRISQYKEDVKLKAITLNEEQQTACNEILGQVRSNQAGVTLLQGVTGSGKTLVYIRLAQQLLQEGKSVIILVPEIALTPQMMARFTAVFGDEVALLHSGLRVTERYDQYKRIRQGLAHLVLGTRSAVFAPVEHLGLIVLDEEQEGSYESEQAPSYHARDIAKYRCAREGARLVLGSATPTVETAYYARNGEYQWSLLRRRFNDRALPQVHVADMRTELREGNFTSVSRTLYEELLKNLQAGEQSILFLNRRGASRQLICPGCGYVPECPRCSVYLTYHRANSRQMCHYCGYSEPFSPECPQCGTVLRQIGAGTQKVEQELRDLFPDTEVLRMDTDSVGTQHEKMLKKFEKEKIPILLGTQMVAKGLDFDNVTLVGVLAADQSLYVDHYRAAERTFALLTQVVGRAGRGEKPGRAVIQTYTPGNEVIQAAARQDFDGFYEREIVLRRLRRDPPFADHLILTVSGPVENEVRRACMQVRDGLLAAADRAEYAALELEILGPAPAGIVKINNRFRYRITVIGRCDRSLRGLVSAFMKEFSRRSENRGMQIFADCNLMN